MSADKELPSCACHHAEVDAAKLCANAAPEHAFLSHADTILHYMERELSMRMRDMLTPIQRSLALMPIHRKSALR